MCGIAGRFHPGIQDAPFPIYPHRIAHRGPDEHHFIKKPFLEMSTHRLAIVSQQDGRQPIEDPRSCWIVSMNGEIYNHETLAREAKANGFPPQNPSDTATLAALLCFLPLEQVLKRLRGMFAFALYHKPSQKLFLIRDRMGVKPLYWNIRSGQLSWGSELSALPTQNLPFNTIAVQQFLLFEYIPAPNTIFEQTYKLRAGEMLCFSSKGLDISLWWTPPQISGEKTRDIGPWKKSFQYALQNAISLRIPPNLPTVIQLSGGIDSTTIASLLPNTSESIAYSLSFEEAKADESAKARQVANILKMELRTVSFHKQDFLTIAQESLAHFSEPCADSSVLPYWKLMQTVQRDGIRCMISGDGADESLGGYPTYSALPFAPQALMLQRSLQSLLKKIPRTTNALSKRNMAKYFVDGLHEVWWKQQMLWMGAWHPKEIPLFDEIGVWEPIFFWAQQAPIHPIARALYLDQRSYLAEGVLQKVDRVSMAFGVEIRSPFMDDRLVSLMADLPINSKIPHKKILRDILAQTFPASILTQKKQGFGAPLGNWIDILSFSDEQKQRLQPFLSVDRLQQYTKEHLFGYADHRRKLWSAYCLAIWLENQEKGS